MLTTDQLFADKTVRAEYDRWMALVGKEDPYESDRTVGLHSVLRAHFLVADFSITNGLKILAIGPKSMDLLHSAVYRQFVTLGQREKWPKSLDKCASLLFGINKGHAFHDANKRTSLLVTLLFLQKKCVNRTPTVSDKIFEDFLVELADNRLNRYPRYRDMSASADPDFEIRFISDWLQRNTREIDKRYYDVTYQQLNGILHRFGFALDNPSKNYIDVVKVEEVSIFFRPWSSKAAKNYYCPDWISWLEEPSRARGLKDGAREDGFNGRARIRLAKFFSRRGSPPFPDRQVQDATRPSGG